MERRVFIIDGKRTAIGKYLGSFYKADPANVCVQLIQKGFSESLIKDIQNVIIGNVLSADLGQGIARKIAVMAGIPLEVPAHSVNMVCGSGIQAIIDGMKDIQCGEDLVLCGGFEFMSNAPYSVNAEIRQGKKMGDFSITDLLVHDGLQDSFSGLHMGITAENIAKQLSISRAEQDEYTYMAQQRAIIAVDGSKFTEEIVPITVCRGRGKEVLFDTDEFPNRNSTLEKLASLKPAFQKGGTVTAGNASGLNDGAAFVLLASEEYCMKKNIRPIAEICYETVVGCDPNVMGLGPYYAIDRLLTKTNLKIENIGYFEINEAFAAQLLGCIKLLSEKYHKPVNELLQSTNIYGSGLALGHPLGATGTRIVVTLAHIIHSLDSEYGIASLCIGGGMGAALLLRNIK
ncbi:MAG: thiolase family protein [Clostridiales bacterium]|nr:thiolase family protein [Clostridiales bacterium]